MSYNHVGSPPATDHHVGSIDVHVSGSCKPKFPSIICKGDHLLKDCPGLSKVLGMWSQNSEPPMWLVSGHHTNDTPLTMWLRVKKVKSKILAFYVRTWVSK